MHMTDEEAYLFDVNGYLVVKGALDPGEVDALNAAVDRHLAARAPVPATGYAHTGMPEDALGLNDDPTEGPLDFFTGMLLDWGPELRSLVGHPGVLGHLVDLLGSGLRLDHQYAIFMQPGHAFSGKHALHNGGTPFDPSQHYVFRDGRAFNGLVAVSYALTPSPVGSGGFCCIPGSHKANLPLPPGYEDLDVPAPAVQEVGLDAGDAVIFTEALTHGALRWVADHERRVLIFKYCPGHVQWERGSPFVAGDHDWSPVQRNLLRPPYRGSRTPVHDGDGGRVSATAHSVRDGV